MMMMVVEIMMIMKLIYPNSLLIPDNIMMMQKLMKRGPQGNCPLICPSVVAEDLGPR